MAINKYVINLSKKTIIMRPADMSFLLCMSSSPLFQISQNQKGKRSQITDPSLSSVFTSLNSSAEFVKLLISLFPEAERGGGRESERGEKNKTYACES